MRLVVVDLGTGNLRSVAKAVERMAPHARVLVSRDPATIRAASRVILPGQGAMGGWIAALDDTALRGALDYVLDQRPVLGICLGLQTLYQASEEDGGIECLNRLAGRVRRFAPADCRLKVPHMGWNEVHQARPHPLWNGIADATRFYFVHSYYADGARDVEVAGWAWHGIRFVAAAARGNLFAVQFHPEKSAAAGLRLIENFTAWDGAV